jgi:hypothetical protein
MELEGSFPFDLTSSFIVIFFLQRCYHIMLYVRFEVLVVVKIQVIFLHCHVMYCCGRIPVLLGFTSQKTLTGIMLLVDVASQMITFSALTKMVLSCPVVILSFVSQGEGCWNRVRLVPTAEIV